MDTVQYSGLQGQILDLLGQGLGSAVVASAVGVTEGYISQLLSNEAFRDQVSSRRVKALQKATTIDNTYDDIEEVLQTKLKRVVPLMMKPRDILDAIKVVNGARRRGTQDMVSDAQAAQVIEIRMPSNILNQFINVEYNSQNQIIKAGEQALITAQPQDIRRLSNDEGREKESTRSISESSEAEEFGQGKTLSLEALE